VSRRYVTMTAAQLAAALAKPGQVVLFQAREGRALQMPLTPEDARKPWHKTPVTSGMVIGVKGDRARVDDSHGECGTIAVADATYLEDPL
jgi:hypothetical protein